MKRTALKKLSIILLFTCIFVNCVSACGNTGTESVNSPENETTVSETETEAAETEAPVNITDERFDGKEFNIIYMTGGSYGMGNEVDYTFEESQSTVVSEAVYERNLLTEEKLGITINGTFCDPAQFNNKIVKLVQSGDSTYDAVLNYLQNNYQLVVKGALLNLRDYDNFCLDNPWWDQGINSAFCFFGNKQFFATGDICIDDDCTTDVILFNKKLEKEYSLPNHYDSVRSGSWTLDTMVSNMQTITTDLNGDGQMDREDRYGIGMSIGGIPAYMIYLGAPSTIINEEGAPVFAYNTQSEKMIKTFEAIFNGLIANPTVVFVERDLKSDFTGAQNMFYNDQFLYKLNAIGGLNSLRDKMEDGFGVIPSPKLAEQQEKYYSAGSPASSTYALPITVENPDQIGAIMNVMAYYSVDTITDTVIQKVVMIRSTRDETSEEMVKIAISDKSYDVGFCLKLGGYVNKLYDIAHSKTNTFVSGVESILEGFNKDIDELINIYNGEE